MSFLWYHSCVVEVIEHQVHVLLRLGGEVGAIEMFVVFVDGDSYAARSYVTGSS